MSEPLTPAEQQIVRCVLNNLTPEQTARCLNLTERTVQQSLHSIYRKLGITTHLELLFSVCSGAVKIPMGQGAAA
jgi:DNA-binding CsgD family transcriptional regulator